MSDPDETIHLIKDYLLKQSVELMGQRVATAVEEIFLTLLTQLKEEIPILLNPSV